MKIFVTVGTQKFQFNRLMKMIDEVSKTLGSSFEFVVQYGYSTYKFTEITAYDFLNQSDFDSLLKDCDILITHGGVGSIHKGLKYNKKVIVVPRLQEYKEHVDSHQLDITNKYSDLGVVIKANNVEELKKAICSDNVSGSLTFTGNNQICNYIERYIRGEGYDS